MRAIAHPPWGSWHNIPKLAFLLLFPNLGGTYWLKGCERTCKWLSVDHSDLCSVLCLNDSPWVVDDMHACHFYQHPFLPSIEVNDQMCPLLSILLSFMPGWSNRWHIYFHYWLQDYVTQCHRSPVTDSVNWSIGICGNSQGEEFEIDLYGWV